MQKSHDISFPQFCQKQNCDVINAHNYDMNGDPKELRSCSVCWSLGVNKLTTESNNDVFCLVHSVGYFVCVLWKYPSTCDEWYKECGLFLDQHLYAQYTVYPAYTQICLKPCFCWSPSHNKDFSVAPHILKCTLTIFSNLNHLTLEGYAFIFDVMFVVFRPLYVSECHSFT